MKSILIIDPSESARGLVKWTGNQAGYTVTDTTTVKEALLYLAIQPFDVVLVDTLLANDFLLQIQSAPRRLPVIIMLEHDQPRPSLSPSNDSLVDYLFKPFDETALLFRLEKHRKPLLGKILILDTSNAITPPIQHMIESMGYALTLLDTDKLLEQIVSEIKPDLAIIDTSLPPLNRETVMAALAGYDGLKTLGIVDSRLSPSAIGPYVRQCTDFITHPLNTSELRFRILRLMPEKPLTTRLATSPPASSTQNQVPTTDPASSRSDKSLLSKVYVTLHHEMRSPLTGILIGAQALSKRVANEERPVVSEIIESAKRIRDTLDTLSISNTIRSEEYVNGTQMAKFETPATPTFHWI
jgi:DNA-binding NtrC family response regulator